MMRERIAGTARQAELSQAERLVLWGMRTWVAALRADIPVDDHIERAFRQVMAPSAAPVLSGMMVMLAEGASRPMSLHQPRCPCLSEDERLLLDLVALVQAGRVAAARMRAAGLLLPTAGRTVAGAVGPFAELLACSGLRIRASEAMPAARDAWAGDLAAPRVLH
jgi:hypothetical protein